MAILLAGRAGSIKLPTTDHRRRRRRRRTGSHWTGSPVGRVEKLLQLASFVLSRFLKAVL